MTCSLTTPQGDELDADQVRETRDSIASTVASQLRSFPGSPRDVLIAAIGEERYEALVRDIANNVTQTLL